MKKKLTYVVAREGCANYFTPGVRYNLIKGNEKIFYIIDDDGQKRVSSLSIGVNSDWYTQPTCISGEVPYLNENTCGVEKPSGMESTQVIGTFREMSKSSGFNNVFINKTPYHDIKTINKDECKSKLIYSSSDDTVLDNDIEKTIVDNIGRPIYVLYSSGYDSTLVLYKALLIARKLGIQINTLSFQNDSQFANSKFEQLKRSEFKTFCLDNNLPIGDTISIDIDNIGSPYGIIVGQDSCPMPIIWAYNLLAYLPINATVLTGYIRGDDFFNYVVYKDWLDAFASIRNLFGKDITIFHPLDSLEKNEVIAMIRRLNIEQYTFYCDLPDVDGKPCGECHSCLKHRAYESIVKA